VSNWKKPIPRVLHRPNLFMGCEREWIQLLIGFSGIIAFVGMNPVAIGCGLVTWVTGHAVLLKAAKADPDWIKIYLRSLRFQHRYSYRARPYRRS
jgi:type IV secretory pathway TrbD component